MIVKVYTVKTHKNEVVVMTASKAKALWYLEKGFIVEVL